MMSVLDVDLGCLMQLPVLLPSLVIVILIAALASYLCQVRLSTVALPCHFVIILFQPQLIILRA